MSKSNVKLVKFSKREMQEDIPAEIDLSKLRFVGRGPKAVRNLAERSIRSVELAPDVFRDFDKAEDVNEALRLVQRLRLIGKKRRKSA